MAENKNITHLAKSIESCVDSDGTVKEVKTGDCVCYFRPGAEKKQWWYNGKVESLQIVQFPSGKHAPVMGIN